MNKKQWIRFLVPVALLLIVVAAVAVLILEGASRETLTDRISTAPALTGKVEPNPEKALLSAGGMKLYLEDSMVVRIEDGRGNVWSTNGLSHDGKPTSGQFKVHYYTANAAYSYMESQSDSVDKQQAEAFLQDDTLYVQYRVGSYGRTVDDVPQFMKNERFTQFFLNKLSEEDAAEMESYYKLYKDDDAWRIRPKGRNNFERILEFMDQVGYTEEDLAQDNSDGGVETEISSKAWFTIVLAYKLTEDGLSVSMPMERIEFSADYPLFEVDLLPHFGLLEQNSNDGYVLLPDGSGALMRFSSTYGFRTEYSIPIYGLDWSVASDTLSTGQFQYEQASLPVFGMLDGTASYLAVVDGSATRAALKFHPAGPYFQRNAAYLTFRMVNKDSVYLSGSDNSSKVIIFESGLAEETCSVHYQFLDNGSGYVEMAAAYRQQLIEEGVLSNLVEEDATVSLLLETICGVRSKKNLLGISYEGVAAATTYEQNRLLAEDLLEAGIQDLDMKLIGWFNGGVYHDYAGSVKLDSILGGKKGFKQLQEFAAGAGVGLYPDVDLQRIEKMNLNALLTVDPAYRLDSNEARFSILSRALLLEKEDIGMTPSNLYLLSPADFSVLTQAFLKDYLPVSTGGLCLRSTRSYSDFNDKDMISRPETVELLQQQLGMLSEKLDLLVENGALYTYAYTQKISGISTDSSHYRVADETVPFLQMVIHGSVKMYTLPINLASNSETSVLRAIEYGVLPNYQVTYEASSILKHSEYSDNFASNYESWREDILASYAKVYEALDGLIGSAITDHEQLAAGVYATTYETGDTVYVNYNQTDAVVDGITVPASGFYRERSEDQ